MIIYIIKKLFEPVSRVASEKATAARPAIGVISCAEIPDIFDMEVV